MRIGLGVWGGVLGTLLAAPALAQNAAGPIISPTTAWNHTWTEILVDLFIIGGIFGIALIYMLFKYRAKSPDEVGTARKLTMESALAWALVPAAIFMADDFMLSAKGWTLWNIQRTVPPNAMEVKVTAYQWYFEFDYGNGATDTDLVVPVGQPVVLRMTSADVIHSFGLNEFRLKEDIMPGRITHLWFYPEKPIETKVVCVEFCGNSHAEMNSAVKAVSKADFDAWLAKKQKKTSSLPQAYPVAQAAVAQANN